MRVWRYLLPVLVGLALVPARAEPPSASELLQKMTEAARELDYRGRLLYMHGSTLSTLELLRARLDGREHERLTQLDGQLAEVIRRGEHVVCVHADQTITRLVNRQSVTPFGLNQRLGGDLPLQYQLLLDGDDRVAGRAALRMRVVPLDGDRFGYRLWADQDSHLLLKSELVDGEGRALERLEFVSLDLAPALTAADFEVPAALRERALDTLDANAHPSGRLAIQPGWLPAGFLEVDRDLRLTGDARQPVAAATFSDGLAAFTLFVETAAGQSEGASRLGPTVAVSRYYPVAEQQWLVTLVGEVPDATAERVLAGLQLGPRRD